MSEQVIVHSIFLGLLLIPVVYLGKLNWRKTLRTLILSIYINIFTYAIISISEMVINHNIMEVSLLILDLATMEGILLFFIDSMLLILALYSFEWIMKYVLHRKSFLDD